MEFLFIGVGLAMILAGRQCKIWAEKRLFNAKRNAAGALVFDSYKEAVRFEFWNTRAAAFGGLLILLGLAPLIIGIMLYMNPYMKNQIF